MVGLTLKSECRVGRARAKRTIYPECNEIPPNKNSQHRFICRYEPTPTIAPRFLASVGWVE